MQAYLPIAEMKYRPLECRLEGNCVVDEPDYVEVSDFMSRALDGWQARIGTDVEKLQRHIGKLQNRYHGYVGDYAGTPEFESQDIEPVYMVSWIHPESLRLGFMFEKTDIRWVRDYLDRKGFFEVHAEAWERIKLRMQHYGEFMDTEEFRRQCYRPPGALH